MRYFLYPVFGFIVLTGYGLAAGSPGTVRSTLPIQRQTIGGNGPNMRGPATAGALGAVGAAPVWRSRFHGPAVYRPPAPRTRSGGGYYGGSSWGK